MTIWVSTMKLQIDLSGRHCPDAAVEGLVPIQYNGSLLWPLLGLCYRNTPCLEGNLGGVGLAMHKLS